MDLTVYLQFVAALVFVLGLIFAAAWGAKRLGMGGGRFGAAGPRRLSVVETLPIDGRRRLMLVRRDGTEHLLLLGASGETVVERGIAAAPGEKR